MKPSLARACKDTRGIEKAERMCKERKGGQGDKENRSNNTAPMLFRSRVKSEQDKVDNIDLLVKVKRNDFNRHNAEIESIIVDEVGGPFRNKELKHVCLIGEQALIPFSFMELKQTFLVIKPAEQRKSLQNFLPFDTFGPMMRPN